MVENYILRKNARAQLGGGIFKSAWLMMVVACLMYEFVLGLGAVVVFGTLLLLGPMDYGMARLTTSMVRGKRSPDFNDLLKGFTDDFGQTVILGLVKEIFIFLWSLLLIVPGIVKSYSYAMSSYIQQDEWNKNWRYCLDKSQEMMEGHKWQLFCLDLSFLGWTILGALCLGLGILFVTPYHDMARANFYEALKASLRNAEISVSLPAEDIFGE